MSEFLSKGSLVKSIDILTLNNLHLGDGGRLQTKLSKSDLFQKGSDVFLGELKEASCLQGFLNLPLASTWLDALIKVPLRLSYL